MWAIDWTRFPGPMNVDEAAIWRDRMGDAPSKDFDFEGLERRVIYAFARATWSLLDCYWRDGEE